MRERPRTLVPSLLAAAGLGTVVVGSFLPWLSSGSVYRNSYETAALAGRLALFDSQAIELALRAWVTVPLLAAVCVALFALRLPRTAATGTLLLGAIVGTVGVACTVRTGEAGPHAGGVAVAAAGPVTTAAGAAVAVLAALGAIVTSTRTGPVARRHDDRGVRP